jgi:hypothetical protein
MKKGTLLKIVARRYDSILNDFTRAKSPGLPDFSSYNIPKRGKNTKIPQNYQMTIKYTQWPYVIYIFHLGIKYTNIFYYKAIQYFPILGSLV